MRWIILSLAWGLLACIWIPEESSAQGLRSSVELALDSLLAMPVETASKYVQKQTEAPAFVTIITREEIRSFGYRTLEEVLRQQVGFYSSNDREYASISFRGLGRPSNLNNKLLILLDGHTLNDGYSGGSRLGSAIPVDLENLDRIEIVRGPGSSIYGARAVSGVVNLVSRKGRDLDGREFSLDAGFPWAAGASGRVGKVLGADGDLFASGSWAGGQGENLYFPELDSPHLNGGKVEDLDWERRFRGLVTVRTGNLFLQASFSQRAKGIPTATYRSTFNHPEAESTDREAYLEARYARAFGKASEFSLRGYADSYDHSSFNPYGPRDSGADPARAFAVETFIESRSVGGEVRVRWDVNLAHRVVLGAETQRFLRTGHEVRFMGAPEGRAEAPYWIFSGFINDEFQVTPKLALTLGLRRDEYSTRGSATTPRSALVYHPAHATTFKLMASEAFRAPNTLELRMDRPAGGILGNPGLDAEKMLSLEAIWEQRFGRAATTVSVFHNRVRNLIDIVEVEAPDSLRGYGTLMFQFQNIRDIRAQGIDVEARVALPLGVLATVGYGYHDAIDLHTEARVVNTPLHHMRVTGTRTSERWGTVGLAIRGESQRRTLYGTETDPVALVDVTLTSQRVSKGFSFQVVVRNLLDTLHSAPGGFWHIQSVIPQPGRSVSLRGTYAW